VAARDAARRGDGVLGLASPRIALAEQGSRSRMMPDTKPQPPRDIRGLTFDEPKAKDGWFYRGMGIIAVLLVIAAFAPGIRDPAGRNAPLTPLVWVHTVVFSSWLLLYLVQTTLITIRRPAVHRRIGVAAMVLAAAVLTVGYATAIAMARRGFDLSGDLAAASDPLGALVFPLGDLVSFGILMASAFWYRCSPAIHKRLILLATTGSLMAAPLAHLIAKFPTLREIPPAILIPLAALYMASALHDRIVHGRVHPVSLSGGVSLLAWAQLRAAVVGPSDAWHEFAGWLIS
jgi:hypothetical protein